MQNELWEISNEQALPAFFFFVSEQENTVIKSFFLLLFCFFLQIRCEDYFVSTTRPLWYQVPIIGTDNVSDNILCSQKKK